MRKRARDKLLRAVQEGVRDDVADLRNRVAALTDLAEESQRGAAEAAARAGELEALLQHVLQEASPAGRRCTGTSTPRPGTGGAT